MGCTSSAPNMTPSITKSEKDESPSDMEEHLEEGKSVGNERGLQSNGIKVLPCDTVDEPALDRINKSCSDTNLDVRKDSAGNEHFMESENENNSSNDPEASADPEEEKLSSMEEVVEKVVELYENGELEIKQTDTEQVQLEETLMQPRDVSEDKVEELAKDDTIANDQEEETPDPASPSQSQSSRATRWEALADIAAELPPSLAVDPVTGQIYALSK